MNSITTKIRKILVATDFSNTSEYAIARAIELAKTNNAEITLLYVVEKKNADEFFDKYLPKILPKSLWLTTEEYYLNLLQEKVRLLRNQKVNIKPMIIASGKPPIKILSYANKYKFDLLITGAHGKYSIRDSFVGTTAEYIANKTKCPVLIIKNKPNKSYKNILVPIDFSKASNIVLDSAIKLFPGATIQLLHVGDFEYENLLKNEEKEGDITANKLVKLKKSILFYLEDKMKKFIKPIRKKDTKISFAIDLGYPAPIILNKYQKKNTDLIVMGTQGHGKKHYLSMGRVSHAILREATKDILFVPPKK